MATTDFSQMLERGLGRAVLYAQQHDMSPFRDVILNACLHCQSYDTQLEESRAVFMWDVIHATPDVPFYRDRILAALAEFDVSAPADIPHEERNFAAEHDLQQLVVMASNFAEEGDSEARQIMYSKFDESPPYAEYLVGSYIIDLDTTAGFEYIIEKTRESLITAEEHIPGVLFLSLEEGVGDQEAQQVLERLTANTDNIPLVEKIKDHRRPYERGPSQDSSYAEIKVTLGQSDFSTRLELPWWGVHASPEQLLEAAQDLLLETDVQRLKNYLRIFNRVAFPLDPTRLFELTRGEDYQVMTLAFVALEHIKSDAVRRFALDNIAQGYKIGRSAGILLARNYAEGDWQFVEKLAASPSDDREDYHSLEWSVRHAWDYQPSEQAVGTLLNLYEYGPCGLCRGEFVEYLHSLDKLPAWMIEECRYDAYYGTRAFIEKTFGTPENPVSA